MSTLLAPAVVLAAVIGTIRIALSQPAQTATTKTEPGRAPSPEGARRSRPADSARRPATAPATMKSAMPAGFQWIDAGPVPRVRSGFALVLLLAVVGALLAVAVGGVVIAISVALRAALA